MAAPSFWMYWPLVVWWGLVALGGALAGYYYAKKQTGKAIISAFFLALLLPITLALYAN